MQDRGKLLFVKLSLSFHQTAARLLSNFCQAVVDLLSRCCRVSYWRLPRIFQRMSVFAACPKAALPPAFGITCACLRDHLRPPGTAVRGLYSASQNHFSLKIFRSLENDWILRPLDFGVPKSLASKVSRFRSFKLLRLQELGITVFQSRILAARSRDCKLLRPDLKP